MYSMRMRIDIGIHAQCNRRACFFCTRNPIDLVQLRFALDIEAANALIERVLDFLTRLAYAGERAFGGIATRGEYTIKFAARNDVKAAPASASNFRIARFEFALTA